MTDKLLPCPFCGGSDVHLRRHSPAHMSWVSCRDCGLEAPSETGTTDEDAVAYWNRRDFSPATIVSGVVAEICKMATDPSPQSRVMGSEEVKT